MNSSTRLFNLLEANTFAQKNLSIEGRKQEGKEGPLLMLGGQSPRFCLKMQHLCFLVRESWHLEEICCYIKCEKSLKETIIIYMEYWSCSEATVDMSRNVHANMISWKDILRNPPACYLPFVLGYFLVPLAYTPPHVLGAVSTLVDYELNRMFSGQTYFYSASYRLPVCSLRRVEQTNVKYSNVFKY